MNLFFLIAERAGPGGRFLEDVTPLVAEDKFEVFKGLPELADRLRKPRDASLVVLVLGPSHEDLKRIFGLREYLQDARILLVLEDLNPETIALAHRVKPTFISDLESGTTGVLSVLRQLLGGAGASRGRP